MTSFAARAHYDRIYARTASLKTDMLLLLRTVRAVVKGTGV
jgi:lipopolysaccharide/colanic/teichoic acid biosynthesis glycosyltransferase